MFRFFGGLVATAGVYGLATGWIGFALFGVFLISSVGSFIAPNPLVVNIVALAGLGLSWAIPVTVLLSTIHPGVKEGTRRRSSAGRGLFSAFGAILSSLIFTAFTMLFTGAVVSIVLSLLMNEACKLGNATFQMAILSQPTFMVLYAITPLMGPEMVASRDEVYAMFGVCS